MNASVAIIIPTYNEEGNIIPLLDDIFTQVHEPLEVCIVDGKSTDNTVSLLQNYIQTHPQVSLIQQKSKEGLSSAYIQGLQYIRQKKHISHALIMDADFSHDPKDVAALIQQRHLFDLIIGSRPSPYSPYQQQRFRNLISRLSNFYTRTVLGVKIADLTTGLNIFKINLLPEDLRILSFAKGFLFQAHLKYYLYKHNARICEHPIVFHKRRLGKSKFSASIILEGFWKIWFLRSRY